MYASLSSSLNQIGANMSKDKDNDDIIEIKHHKKIEGEPLYVSEDVFGPEETIEIGEYDLICLEREAENLARLQIDLIVSNTKTLEDVHALQDTKINILAENLIKYQAEEYEDLNEENNRLEESIEKIVYRWKNLHDTLEEEYRTKHPKDFKKFTVAQEKKRDKDLKTLLDTVRERKFD